MDLMGTAMACKWLKIRFESRTMVLINVATSEVAVGVTVLAVEVGDKDGYQRQKYFH